MGRGPWSSCWRDGVSTSTEKGEGASVVVGKAWSKEYQAVEDRCRDNVGLLWHVLRAAATKRTFAFGHAMVCLAVVEACRLSVWLSCVAGRGKP